MPATNRPSTAVLLIVLPLLVMGCASAPQPLPPLVVAPPAIPPLPQEARQPQALAICLPTCSDGLARLLEALLLPLMPAGPQALPVSGGQTK